MERVAFIVDATGERIDCLLNPETFDVKRLAGIRASDTGDDAVRFTGGGAPSCCWTCCSTSRWLGRACRRRTCGT
ncbi:hypothetical protein [Dactylosporangium cerinum]